MLRVTQRVAETVELRALRGCASLSSSVRYFGASALTFSMNFVCSVGSNFCGGVVRVATGTPTSLKKCSLSRRGADTEKTCRAIKSVVELMGSVGGNI
jgi:hypothetical protein